MADYLSAEPPELAVSIGDILLAARAIEGAIERTPARKSHTLSKIAGAEIFLKFENFQFTASFKERGALNKFLSLNLAQRAHGVVAMSAGYVAADRVIDNLQFAPRRIKRLHLLRRKNMRVIQSASSVIRPNFN